MDFSVWTLHLFFCHRISAVLFNTLTFLFLVLSALLLFFFHHLFFLLPEATLWFILPFGLTLQRLLFYCYDCGGGEFTLAGSKGRDGGLMWWFLELHPLTCATCRTQKWLLLPLLPFLLVWPSGATKKDIIHHNFIITWLWFSTIVGCDYINLLLQVSFVDKAFQDIK